MFNKIKQYFNQKNLLDERYRYLFDKSESDEYICFDVETTGLDTKVDDIISIGAVKIKDNKILTSQKFERFVKPKSVMNEESIKIHRIRCCDLEEASEIDEVIEDFLAFIGNRKLVGYYLEFDVAMINRVLKPRIGITLPNEQIEVSALYYDFKIGAIPQGNVDLRFDTIMKELKLPFMGKHDALNDAIMTAMIFIKLNKMKGIR
ncbi:MAG TPA: 3'-5' exonuclease [Campylobacterales bacterium]|nr:3'-5' exonuclease [Campylobacterales bacterium]